MQLHAAVPFIEQKLTTMEAQIAPDMVQTNSKMNDISTGRAPLNNK